MKRIRVLNSRKYLSAFLDENEIFFIGISYEDYLKSENLDQYGLPKMFQENHSVVPRGRKTATTSNVKGKLVRKQPEEKELKTVHIRYTRKDGSLIEFDRDFFVFKKELLFKLEMSFTFIENEHGEKMVVSKPLTYRTDLLSNQIHTNAINIFCEIFNDFEVLTESYEPAIHFNKRFESDLLPHGKLSGEKIDELMKITKSFAKNEMENKAFQKRLHLFMDFEPDIRGKGPANFYGYIVFGFSDLGIVILESMYSGNATYVFKMEDYENNIIKDKQLANRSKQLLKKFVHTKTWESKMKQYLNSSCKR